ncbi:MAG TPA: hypothetical protein VL021_01145 [Brumimicrobium sp.]|nr:hypothetical protein [Brumimicrobium sp.]
MQEKGNILKIALYILVLSLSIVLVPIFYYIAMDTAASLTYEVDPGGCISKVSGKNLCAKYDLFMGLTYGCGILFFLTMFFVMFKVIRSRPSKS